MPKLRDDDGSERQNWEVMMMTLNVKPRMRLWMSIWKHGDGSERRNWKVMMALNAELKIVVTTLNAETDDATLNVDLKTDDGSERRTKNSDNDSEHRNWEVMMMTLNIKLRK